MNVLLWNLIGIQQRDRQDLNDDNFCRLLVTSAQCVIGTEKFPDAGKLLVFDNGDYSQGYGLTEEAFRALTYDDILQPYKS